MRQPADWMRPIGDRILEVLQTAGITLSPVIIVYNYDMRRKAVYRQLAALAERGLANKVERGRHEIISIYYTICSNIKYIPKNHYIGASLIGTVVTEDTQADQLIARVENKLDDEILREVNQGQLEEVIITTANVAQTMNEEGGIDPGTDDEGTTDDDV